MKKLLILILLILISISISDCKLFSKKDQKKEDKTENDINQKTDENNQSPGGSTDEGKNKSESERIKDEILAVKKEIQNLEYEKEKTQRKIDEKNYRIRELKGKYKFSLGLEMEKLQKEMNSLSGKTEYSEDSNSTNEQLSPETEKNRIEGKENIEGELIQKSGSESPTQSKQMRKFCKRECKKIYLSCKSGCSDSDKECLVNCAGEAKLCLEACKPESDNK